jgi:preprotein translocase subunit SecE
MSRALRRQPLVRKPPAKAPAFRPSGPRPAKKQEAAAVGAAVTEAVRSKRTLLERIPLVGRQVQEIANELRKVTWPTREETTRLTFAVVVVAVAMGLALGGIDIAFNWLVDNTLLR